VTIVAGIIKFVLLLVVQAYEDEIRWRQASQLAQQIS